MNMGAFVSFHLTLPYLNIHADWNCSLADFFHVILQHILKSFLIASYLIFIFLKCKSEGYFFFSIHDRCDYFSWKYLNSLLFDKNTMLIDNIMYCMYDHSLTHFSLTPRSTPIPSLLSNFIFFLYFIVHLFQLLLFISTWAPSTGGWTLGKHP